MYFCMCIFILYVFIMSVSIFVLFVCFASSGRGLSRQKPGVPDEAEGQEVDNNAHRAHGPDTAPYTHR